ncbi:DUF4428 domain-containing protein [Streptococcus zalophi]|uniref:DUF4428 domain-containing protein n=1 Tax=Streptococcus zalophi TaxID=640031 RepID=UPI00215C1F59|nr:DUF4428 domain-containing protein [Streptococcus zalophi]MCR8967313.1 DUF4428 domain-containing protein [Streptococcus zalophi]
MGLFEKFKKQTCAFCGGKADLLKRKKLKDDNYICAECQKKTSGFLVFEKLDKASVDEHMLYMMKQNALYEQEFVNTDITFAGNTRNRIEFSNDIGMFHIISRETRTRDYQELFRYDAVRDYSPYLKEHHAIRDDDTVAYDYMGVKIILFCKNPDIVDVSANLSESSSAHPFLQEVFIKTKLNVDREDVDEVMDEIDSIIRKFDYLFGKIDVKRTFGLSSSEKRDIEGATSLVKGASEFIKAFSKNEDTMDAKHQMVDSSMDLLTKNRTKYGRLADKAEKRVGLR